MNLYVGNLAYSTTDEELRTAFEQFGGVVSAKVVMDKYSGRSRGFGFVEMADEAGGRAAIEGLNGQSMGGRALNVSEARPRQDFGEGGGRGDRPGRDRF